MQKFITGLAVGIVAGTLLVTCSKQARELACASKEFADKKLQNAKDGVEDKTEEIKEKTAEVAKESQEKTPAKKSAVKKPQTKKQDLKQKSEAAETDK